MVTMHMLRSTDTKMRYFSACGIRTEFVTAVRPKVVCKRCRKTKMFRATERKR